MTFPRVYIILLNYKGWKDTIECLESVVKCDYPNFRIIIVDNDSRDHSCQNIIEWAKGGLHATASEDLQIRNLVLPLCKKPIDIVVLSEVDISSEKNTGQNKLTLISSSSNRGFSAGNNIGIRYALLDEECAFVWLLNNDTVVPHSTLRNLVSHHNLVSEHSKLGILGCRLLFYDQPNVQQAYAGKFNKWTCVTSHIGENEDAKAYIHRNVEEYDYPIGASLFVPTEFIKEVGLLDEAYFLYFEELDWTQRGKKRDWISCIDDTSFVYHKHGVSTGNSSTLNRSLFSEKVILASKVLFLKKHYPWLLFSMVATFPIVLINRIKRGQYKRVPILIGYFAACLFKQVIWSQSLPKRV